MTDKEQAKAIMGFTERQLLEYVFTYPEYLTDGYYSVLGDAMRKRYKQLKPKGRP